MNAIALIASQTWHDHPVDLLLSLLAQSLTGLLLGAGIQRLRELNQSLQTELARNRRLAERLLETEESVRQEVARELHDDIGQTITAIRTQAGIVQRLAAENAGVKQGGAHIEQLSLGVYDSVRRLLGRLRPRQLDDLSLEQAVRSLMREMELESRGIVSHLDWRINEAGLSENQRVTLFRVCQEGLNNIVKHASASAVTLQGWQQEERLMLVLEDDGCGLPPGSSDCASLTSRYRTSWRVIVVWRIACWRPKRACAATSRASSMMILAKPSPQYAPRRGSSSGWRRTTPAFARAAS